MQTASSDRAFIPKEQLTAWERWEMAALAEASTPRHRAAPAAAHAVVDEQARANGYAVGVAEGQKTGHAAGYAAGLAAGHAEAAALTEVVVSARAALDALGGTLADRTVQLAIAIAQQVIRSELATRPESILAVLRDAMGNMPGSDARLQIHVNPADAAILHAHMGDEMNRNNWQAVEDPSMQRGGCRLVSNEGDVDATLATRWKNVLAALGQEDKNKNDKGAA